MDLTAKQISDVHDALDGAISDGELYVDSHLAASDYAGNLKDLAKYKAKVERWRVLLPKFA